MTAEIERKALRIGERPGTAPNPRRLVHEQPTVRTDPRPVEAPGRTESGRSCPEDEDRYTDHGWPRRSDDEPVTLESFRGSYRDLAAAQTCEPLDILDARVMRLGSHLRGVTPEGCELHVEVV
jgi:hypothetical protein